MQHLLRKFSLHDFGQYCVLLVEERREPLISKASLTSSIPKVFGLFQFGSLGHLDIWKYALPSSSPLC